MLKAKKLLGLNRAQTAVYNLIAIFNALVDKQTNKYKAARYTKA
jgi:hypothetical protein